ncbi:MAG: circadian clock protein KaiA [Oscillatoriales cyanobacterium C42_A2020_001]|nr:circadian clock protein KaiA [Leptolyngbyaceae cyanobacterium C42_A2020_001]
MQSILLICTFLPLDTLAHAVSKRLSSDRYQVSHHHTFESFCQFVEQEKHRLDCLILQSNPELVQVATWLYGQATLLPAILLSEATVADPHPSPPTTQTQIPFQYHTAEVLLSVTDLEQLDYHIEQAIAQFISLSPTSWLKNDPFAKIGDQPDNHPLVPQQQRLIEKLKERLGYLGVYYKRDPNNFFRYLPPEQKVELLEKLKLDYRDIVLRYFANDGTLNQRIDDFVNTVFFTDVSAAQVVEIHMELIDEFSKQLKLEGRSEEILLDYRLTLIDTIAHLCEMYRRSIPRES